EYGIGAYPDVYIGLAYLQASNNYGYPSLRTGGIGVEKLPTFDTGWSWFGSAFYYPNANGTFTETQFLTPAGALNPNYGKTYKVSYNIIKYDIGLNVNFSGSPFYIYGGFSGDRYTTKDNNEPVDQTHAGPYVGL